MSKKDIQRKWQCRGCLDMKFCTVYWGYECSRNGGQRIPRMKYRDWNRQEPKPNQVVTISPKRKFLDIVPREVLIKEGERIEEVN